MSDNRNDLGKALKQRRLLRLLTLRDLAAAAGVSPSHLGRIERGERYPSGKVLRKIAPPLGFAEGELFSLVGLLSPVAENQGEPNLGEVDPHVVMMLSQESVEVQRIVIAVLALLKGIAGMKARGGLG